MEEKKSNISFWNRYAKLYDFEISRFNRPAYEEMYRMISNTLSKKMHVLEIATGTGLIAINIAPFVGSVEAIDFAPLMIEAAKKKGLPPNVHFSVADATALSFDRQTFDAVIISNALHIMPQPVSCAGEHQKSLKPNGILIAPTFSHGAFEAIHLEPQCPHSEAYRI